MSTRPMYALVALALLVTGCARVGDPLVRRDLAGDAPEVAAILSDLQENAERIQRFKATGKFIVQSPDLDSIYNLRHSEINFQRPDGLYVVGRKYATNMLMLTSRGDEFLIELPRRREYHYRTEGETIDSVSFRVAPVDVANEMFLPEDWAALRSRQVKMDRYDAENQVATLSVYTRGFRPVLRRVIEVQGVPWRVVKNERYDTDGTLIAVTTKSDYHVQDGVYFPRDIMSVFPTENARMGMRIRSYFLNRELEPGLFDVTARYNEVLRKGYTELETAPAS